MKKDSLIYKIQEGIKDHWDLPSLSDYQSEPVCYRDVATQIAKLHLLYKECGIEKGDKIVICGRNSASWAVSFFSVITYGAVAVPLLHEFKPDSIHHLVNHSEAKFLLVGDVIWDSIDVEAIPNISSVIIMQDFSMVHCKEDKHNINLEEIFEKRYPEGINKDDLKYEIENPDDLAIISYTSGTTSLSKGVMIPYRSMHSNYLFATEVLPDLKPGMNMISMLPMAHMYGLQFETIFQFITGIHIHFLTRVPSPKIISEAFSRIKPDLIVAVPLIIEKIYWSKLKPMLDKTYVKILLNTPIIDTVIKNKILNQLNEAFGNNFVEVIIGGAALNQEVEAFFKKIGFSYTVGYGMTECAPIIAYEGHKEHKLYSCGKAVPRMEIRIDSPDPENIVGEILTRGDNLMLGYYKNQEATEEVLKDGWLHTGDLGVMDKEGNLYIKGRSKNMILGPSGQNIFPEEIEDALNSMEYVSESLVMEKEGKLVALVYLDQGKLDEDKIDITQSKRIMRKLREDINKELPSYSQINYIYIQEEEFEKTPKRSIKRYLYNTVRS